MYVSLVEYLPNCERHIENSSIRNESITRNLFKDMLCSGWRGEFWEEDILIAEIEESEKLDASEIYPRRLNAKEVL